MTSTFIKPDKTKNEDHRIKVLKSLNILDTPPEERYDRITRVTKKAFNLPIALISIVDEDRQWFKSCIGLNKSETDRDISFCGHAILGDEVFVIEDTLNDYRFKDNPMVTSSPFIRFYAGVPLKYLDGSNLGTLCIKDIKPREFSNYDMKILKDLGAIVENEINSIHLATMDELTGILNRRGFIILAENSMKMAKRLKLTSTFIYLDLNKFKPINDNYGHEEGDRVLRFFSKSLKELSRESDIIARMGGDEFVVILTNTISETAELFISRLKTKCKNFETKCGDSIDIDFAAGIFEVKPGLDMDIDIILNNTDKLMYKEKRSR